MILVTGATGHVGTALLTALSVQKTPVRAMIRPGTTLRGFDGVETVEADFANPASIKAALDGVDAMFLLSPGVSELEKAAIEAACAAELGRVVLQSVLNADEGSPCAILSEHGRSEGYLIDSGVPYVILRPNSFMQNILDQNGPLIRAQSILPMPMGDAKISHVDVRDIAEVAAAALLSPAFEGETLEITGPRALSFTELAAILSNATGRPITYVNAPEADTKQAMIGMGMPASYADAVLALFATYRDGDAEFVVPTVEEVTGRPARTFEDFAKENAAAFAPNP